MPNTAIFYLFIRPDSCGMRNRVLTFVIRHHAVLFCIQRNCLFMPGIVCRFGKIGGSLKSLLGLRISWVFMSRVIFWRRSSFVTTPICLSPTAVVIGRICIILFKQKLFLRIFCCNCLLIGDVDHVLIDSFVSGLIFFLVLFLLFFYIFSFMLHWFFLGILNKRLCIRHVFCFFLNSAIKAFFSVLIKKIVRIL